MIKYIEKLWWNVPFSKILRFRGKNEGYIFQSLYRSSDSGEPVEKSDFQKKGAPRGEVHSQKVPRVFQGG